jgi:hypothetical protein
MHEVRVALILLLMKDTQGLCTPKWNSQSELGLGVLNRSVIQMTTAIRYASNSR